MRRQTDIREAWLDIPFMHFVERTHISGDSSLSIFMQKSVGAAHDERYMQIKGIRILEGYDTGT
jgi:hypothetical protein